MGDRNWESEMSVREEDEEKEEINWEDLMTCEEQGDTSGMKERALSAEEREAIDSKKKKSQNTTHEKKSQQQQQHQHQRQPLRTSLTKSKEITGWFVAIRQILVGYQYVILAVLLAMWTITFYKEKGSMKLVMKDKLWWIGTFVMTMLLSLSFYDRDINSLSAYSMLNKGGERLPGDASPDDILGISRFTENNAPRQRVKQTSLPHGLDHQLFSELSNNRYARNDMCPCKSGLKFKSCCFDLQQRLKTANKKVGGA